MQAKIARHELNMVDHDTSPDLWNMRLGHITQKVLEVFVKGKHLLNLKNTYLDLYTLFGRKVAQSLICKKVTP